MRRARMGAAMFIDERQVFERDGWRCQICSRLVNRNVRVPHPKAPTLDHIVPVSLGGEHTLANVQLAHFRCNCAKNNRAVGEQLRLIG